MTEPATGEQVVAGQPVSGATAPMEFTVLGMSCAACANRIERKLNKLPHVEAVVNFATERAVVRGLEPADADTVVATVEKAGYRAIPEAEDDRTDHRAGRLRSLRRRILLAGVLTLPLSQLTIGLALADSLRFPGWEILCVALATPVVWWAAWPFHRAAWRNLTQRSTSMDTLVSLGVLTAYLWAVGSILFGGGADSGYWLGWGEVPAGADTFYLEVAAAVTTFQLIGRYFELRARGAASDVLGALRSLAPKQARLRRPDGRDVSVPIAAVEVGDSLVVRAGEVVAADATVTTGSTSIDTSAMTGEARPREVGVGEAIHAGTVNLSGVLIATVDRTGSETQLEQMATLAEQAQARKANVQRLVDRVVSIFVPVVLAISALTLIGWLLLTGDLPRSVSAALSVLVIACPCALGLATPTAIMVGIGRAGQLGIVIKGPDAFETSGHVTTAVLDKTGTITTGEFTVDEVVSFTPAYDSTAIGQLAALAERDSEHPLGKAIARLGRERSGADVHGEDASEANLTSVHIGQGVSARIDGRTIRVGSADWLSQAGFGLSARAREFNERDDVEASVLVADESGIIGGIQLSDTIRPDAQAMVGRLNELGLRTVLLTGDRQAPANRVGAAIGVDTVIPQVLPTQKAATVESLQATGERVVMVGDGINDAAALATADLGIAVASGTDLAMRAADVIVVRRHVDAIADAIELSRRTMRTIRGNLIWAFGYNVAAIPVAAAGWLNPIIAGFTMALSSLFVVGNSLRLRNYSAHRDAEVRTSPDAP